MRRTAAVFLTLGAVALGAAVVRGHDMFLVVADHDVTAHSSTRVDLFNGTFEKSENVIDRDRMIDVSIVDGAGAATHPGEGAWQEEGNVTVLPFQTGAPGTYVVGVSTRARMIELSGKDFNDYLEHDGVLDVLAARRDDGTLDEAANERYSKHVKTILQVGDSPTESFSHRLGYPIEIVPATNPATLQAGDTLDVLILADGEPVAGQLVYASYEGFHAHGDSGDHQEAVSTRTNESGVASIPVSRPGRWYARLIRMVEVDEEGVDYESNWATLTFEVR